ncbi:MAG: translocation/assembly module TamB domain-containing protein [Chitinophagaceae bacterium]|nr:translocation/assembly module TamB domain-containing protein [Chitinophagaceae bacterium]
MEQQPTKKNGWKKAGRILLKTLLWIFLLIIVLFLLLLTPPVQQFVTKKATRYLENKLDTRVSIGRLFVTLGGRIALDDVYIEDRQRDTLLAAGNLRVRMSLGAILFDGEIDIKSIQLSDATVKLRRQLPDTAFNFQFIVDAFGSTDTTTVSKPDEPASATSFNIGSVQLDNVRLVYKDVVTGNDITAQLDHLSTRARKLDLDHLIFGLDKTSISGLTATVIQVSPLSVAENNLPAETENDEDSTSALTLDLGRFLLENAVIDYRDSVGALYTRLEAGRLDWKPGLLVPDKGLYDLGSLQLANTRAAVRMGKQPTPQTTATAVQAGKDTLASTAMRLLLRGAELTNVTLQYDDDNEARQQQAFDYAHINTSIDKLQLADFIMDADSLGGRIERAVLKDHSGFSLAALQGRFLYSDRKAAITDLYLKTGSGTELQRRVELSYPSLAALTDNPAALTMNLQIEKSSVRVADVLYFVPSLKEQPAFANANDTWFMDGSINGRLDNLTVNKLEVRGLSQTSAKLSGTLKGLPDSDKLTADLTINEMATTGTDLYRILPANSVPASVALPAHMRLHGKINGSMKEVVTALDLQTSAGDLSVSGTASSLTDSRAAAYDMQVKTRSLQLGKILKDTTMMGGLTAELKIKGTGYDPEYARASMDGIVDAVTFNGYTYRQLALTGSLDRQVATATAAIADSNIDFNSRFEFDMAGLQPSLRANIAVDSIKLQALHLSADPFVFRGKISADFDRIDPDSLMGQLLVTEALLVNKQDRVALDTVQLKAGDVTGGGQYLHLKSDIADLRLEGKYRLSTLPNVFMQAIDPYYDLGEITKDSSEYDFTLNAVATDRPLLRALVPGLDKLDGLKLESHFSSKSGIQAELAANELIMDGNRVTGLLLTANTADSVLKLNMAARQLASGTSLLMDSSILQASLANNKIDLDLLVKDRAAKDRYALKAQLEQQKDGSLVFALKPQGLLLNYEKWDVSTANNIILTADGGLQAQDFTLSQGSEQLSLQSLSKAANAPLHVKFSDFRLSTFTSMVMADSSLVDGRLTGELDLRDLQTKPAFTGDVQIKDLSYHRDTIGNVTARVSNSGGSDLYYADVTLSGRGNEASVKGSYNAASAAVDLNVDLDKLPLKTAEAFSGGSIRNTTGYVAGPFRITGSINSPSITGDLKFHQAGLNVAMLNSYFRIDNEQLRFTRDGLKLDRFEVKDSAGNSLTLNGTLATRNYVNYKFDLDVRATNFRALNSTKADNDLFWGQLYFNTNLKIKGTEQSPVVDGRLTINDKTKMTVVLPQSDPGIVDRNGVIEFVDMDAPVEDSLFMLAYDSLNTSGILGMDVSLNVEINKGADFTLIIDAGNGDFLNVKGEAQLTTGIDPSGKITMVGTYELDQGAYELSFNMIRKKFDIQRGSKIVWEGEPTSANVNITAKYVSNTAPLDLVKGQLDENISAQERNTYLQRLPFEVMLKMTGELMKPQISFDILLPENKSYGVSNDILTNVRTKLEQLRQSAGDMNKQVFSLLLLNRFVAENPFSSLASQNSASTLLRQSVSKLLTEQLNRLAEGLIQGVDINLGIESSDDYTTGERQDKTDLNVGLSKRLLNDRLTVTVGSNFALEGPQNSNQQSNNIAGNVAIDYALSSDGRYKLRAYRKNDYQGVIDGYVVETGMSFIITLDYNKFEQIFQSRKKQQRLRNERRARQEGTPPQPQQ